MLDTYARSSVQGLLFRPVAAVLVRLSVSHHLVTLGALVVGVAIAPLLAFGFPYLAVGCLLLSGYLDAIDGSMARLTAQESPAGCLFDIISDRIVEAAIIVGLYWVDPAGRSLLCLLMMASVLLCISSFLGVGVFSENSGEKSFHYSPGLMERTEAFLFFGSMILFPGLFGPLAALFVALVGFTAIWRVREFYQLQG
jgi:archaetidylinositol phosphate synthase